MQSNAVSSCGNSDYFGRVWTERSRVIPNISEFNLCHGISAIFVIRLPSAVTQCGCIDLGYSILIEVSYSGCVFHCATVSNGRKICSFGPFCKPYSVMTVPVLAPKIAKLWNYEWFIMKLLVLSWKRVITQSWIEILIKFRKSFCTQIISAPENF